MGHLRWTEKGHGFKSKTPSRNHHHKPQKLHLNACRRFYALGVQSSSRTATCEVPPRHLSGANKAWLVEKNTNKNTQAQQITSTSRYNKHHLTLNIILLNQQRFMGLSGLVAAGPPDPRTTCAERHIERVQLNQRLVHVRIKAKNALKCLNT